MALGTLFVVATPLGNLGDLSPRAAATLREVPYVVAEDARESRKLMDHVGGRGRMLSYHAHSSDAQAERVLDLLRDGHDVALVTDAGTPAVSDPGAELVAEAAGLGVRVVTIPGPSAVAATLAAAGLSAGRYRFIGFPPRKGTERADVLTEVVNSPDTVVAFEAPGRVDALLRDLADAGAGDRSAVVARELTKIHEEFWRGTVADLATRAAAEAPRGECTVAIQGTGRHDPPPADEAAGLRVAGLLAEAGVDRRLVRRILTEGLGLSRNQSYRLTLEREP